MKVVSPTARSLVRRCAALHAYACGERHVNAMAGVLAEFASRIRTASDDAEELGDQDTADICTEVSRGIDKWLWFVEAHVQMPVRR